MRRGHATLLALLVLLVVPAGATAATSADAALERSLTATMRGAGSYSGAYVLNATDRTTLFKYRADSPRVLASNTKLFTASAALDDLGIDSTLPTTVLADGTQEPDGTFRGNLYLRGGGDPTFGSSKFARRSYGQGASVEELAGQLDEAGITRVTGRIYGDESRYDSLRGGPYSNYRTSIYVGPLSALSYNRGFASENGTSYQSNPPAFAAARLDAALESRDIAVRGKPAAQVAPAGLEQIAAAQSPPVKTLVRLMMKPSDNYFAEMLVKQLGAAPGTTRSGTQAAVTHARGLGARVRLADGSGLARGNQASPRAVGQLLDAMMQRPEFAAFQRSLPIAGKDGTLNGRMEGGPARGRCRGKTGTINGVSALSGYCRSKGGDTLVFSFLMNGVNVSGARRLQDRMAQVLAGYRG